MLVASSASAVSSSYETAQSAARAGLFDVAEGNHALLRVFNPATAAKRTSSMGESWDTGGNRLVFGGHMLNGVSHDGIRLFVSAGTLTGNVRVYGLNPF
jgi:hypothetical protein